MVEKALMYMAMMYRLKLIFLNQLTLLSNNLVLMSYLSALRNLVAFVQFKKCEKHPWKSVNFSKTAG